MKLTDEPIVANIIKLSYLTVQLLSELLGLRPATLFKKRLWHRRFPVNFVKFLRTLFFIEHFWWLLLHQLRLSPNLLIYRKVKEVIMVKSITNLIMMASH